MFTSSCFWPIVTIWSWSRSNKLQICEWRTPNGYHQPIISRDAHLLHFGHRFKLARSLVWVMYYNTLANNNSRRSQNFNKMNTSNTTTTNAMQGASLLRANAGRDLTCTWRPGVCKPSCRHCIDEAEAIPSGPVDNCKANSTPTSSLKHTGFQQEKSINHTHTHVCTQRYIYIYMDAPILTPKLS